MADVITIQDLVDGRLDVKGMATFYNGPAGQKVPRRLADDIETLEFYLEYMRGLQAVYEQPSGMVEVNGVQVKPVKVALKEALDAAVVGGGGLADTAVATVPQFAGAIARTQASKNKESISIKDFGAKGDGVSGDSDAINLAIAALTSGTTLVIPPCSSFYRIDKKLSALPANITIKSSPNTWLKNDRTLDLCLGFMVADNTVIDGLCYDVNTYPLTGGMTGTWTGKNFGIASSSNLDLVTKSTNNVVIKNCHIINAFVAIRGDSLTNSYIFNNKIRNTQSSGMLSLAWDNADINNVRVFDNDIAECGDTAIAFLPRDGQLSLGVVSSVSVYNNFCKNTQYRTGGYAIDFEGKGGVERIKDIEIYNNKVVQEIATQYDQSGITCQGLSYIIKDNNVQSLHLVQGISGVGINSIKADSKDITISNNTVTGFKRAGIFVNGVVAAKVTGNTLTNCGTTTWVYPAISLSATSANMANIDVTNNVITQSDISTDYVAISLRHSTAGSFTSKNINISSNILYMKSGLALEVRSSNANGLTVSKNTVMGTCKGLVVRDSANAYIYSNIFQDLNSSLVLQGNTALTVRNNDFISATAASLYSIYELASSTGINISDNYTNIGGSGIFFPSETFDDSSNNISGNKGSFKNNSHGITGLIATNSRIATGLKKLGITSFSVTPMTSGVTDLVVLVDGYSLHLMWSGVASAKFSWTATNSKLTP